MENAGSSRRPDMPCVEQQNDSGVESTVANNNDGVAAFSTPTPAAHRLAPPLHRPITSSSPPPASMPYLMAPAPGGTLAREDPHSDAPRPQGAFSAINQEALARHVHPTPTRPPDGASSAVSQGPLNRHVIPMPTRPLPL
jgi:hypothetical protein